MGYSYIDVVDTAILCGLDIRQSTLDSIQVQAKCPHCNDHKYRLYLCREPNNPTYFCHNCGSGGNSVTLFSYRYNVSTKEAFKSLINNPSVHTEIIPYQYERTEQLRRIKPLWERSRIYLELLKLLPLSNAHYQNLKNRGLTDEIIKGNMYRSVPMNYAQRQRVVDMLASRYNLTDMPGFHTKEMRWRMAGRSGILIPVCDKDNNIQGLQIRLDEPPPKEILLPDGIKKIVNGDRFRWFSTYGEYYQNGTGVNGYIHVAGDLSSDTLHVTEGPMKADIASYLSGGELFIGLTGVNNLRYLADIIHQLNPKKIVECIDMDKRSNLNVINAMTKIQAICLPLCEEYEQFFWPEIHKGIDDFFLSVQQDSNIKYAA